MNCLMCGKELTGGLDTFGPIGKELCQECFNWEPPVEHYEHDERGPFEWMYGYFGGGDPRDFTPDYDLCTQQEIENWQKDKADWEAGNGKPCPPAGYWNEDHTIHVLAPRYGIGVYKLRLNDGE